MANAKLDFTGLGELWQRSLERGLAKLSRNEPSHHFYALAFHLLYAEEDGVIAMPAVAVNSVEALREDHGAAAVDGQGFCEAVRWNPADWRWVELIFRTVVSGKRPTVASPKKPSVRQRLTGIGSSRATGIRSSRQ